MRKKDYATQSFLKEKEYNDGKFRLSDCEPIDNGEADDIMESSMDLEEKMEALENLNDEK